MTRTKARCERCGRLGDVNGLRLLNGSHRATIDIARFVCVNADACMRRAARSVS